MGCSTKVLSMNISSSDLWFRLVKSISFIVCTSFCSSGFLVMNFFCAVYTILSTYCLKFVSWQSSTIIEAVRCSIGWLLPRHEIAQSTPSILMVHENSFSTVLRFVCCRWFTLVYGRSSTFTSLISFLANAEYRHLGLIFLLL